MAEKIVLADTSLLIDFFRKSDKSKSQLVSLIRKGYTFCICVITEYEIYSGATEQQLEYWQEFLKKITVINLDQAAVKEAVNINNQLKTKRKQIDLADLFIAAIAVSNNLPVATLNKKHFTRVESLLLVE
ncbi:type II toxin-antitoxin system VapC family toxin [Mucilaginibacter sp. McL0603]|uniref:type II toxin-antitoxin system VapC family toxin n=1 Tax=Mucilaginibacter sp. McL0603 TaxID=3415670 RepID=UPI003CE743D4